MLRVWRRGGRGRQKDSGHIKRCLRQASFLEDPFHFIPDANFPTREPRLLSVFCVLSPPPPRGHRQRSQL